MDVSGCKNAGFVQDEEFFPLQILLLLAPQQFTKGCCSFPLSLDLLMPGHWPHEKKANKTVKKHIIQSRKVRKLYMTIQAEI